MEFVREGAMTKRLHVGRGAQMGLESALLAARGFTGPSTVLEGDRGFLKVYSPSPRPELLVEGLGQSYLLMEMTVKAYACHASFHPVIEGICRFREEHKYDSSSLEGVKVVATERMVDRHGQREPASVLGAQYSLPFSMAVALCRDIADPKVYSEDNLWDAQVRRLAKSVVMDADRERFGKPGGPAAEVSLTIAGTAHTFTVADWKGAPTNPYTYQEIVEKFRRYAAPYLPSEPMDAIIHEVSRLEDVRDVAELVRLIRNA
jgi:2-methylcitrate dehydratase PrpD